MKHSGGAPRLSPKSGGFQTPFTLGGHAIWERDIEPQIAGFPEALQAWYRDVNTETLMLNVQERCLRYERRALKKLLERLRQ